MRDQHGNPVPGADVRLSFGVTGSWSEPLADLTTDAHGAFRCDAAPLDAVSALQRPHLVITTVATKRGFHPAHLRLDLGQHPDHAKRPITLELPRFGEHEGLLSGLVRDRFGEPVRGAWICREDRPQETYAVTDEQGRYAVGFPPGFSNGTPETLFACHPDHGVSPGVLSALPGAGQQTRLDFALTVADPQIHGVVLSSAGLPLPGVRLLAHLEQVTARPPRPYYRSQASIERHTDQDGRFRLRGFAPGRYSIRWNRFGDDSCFLDGLPIVERHTTTGPEPIEIRLPAVPVDFEILDTDGRPIRSDDVIVAGEVTPPPGYDSAPREFELRGNRRLWLPPGSRGRWLIRGAGLRPQAGGFEARGGRLAVRIVPVSR